MRAAAIVAGCLLIATTSFANSKELVNADWVIAARTSHMETFTANRELTLTAEVVGVKNTAKGFGVRVVNADDVTSCRVQGGTCRALAEWGHPSESRFTHTGKIPAGRWAFMVENNQNIFERATVHVQLSIE
jgi:hypothetical protein